MTPSFSRVDCLDFDFVLSYEGLLARQTARQFVDEKVIYIIERHFRDATLPEEPMSQLGELGYFGSNLKGSGCAEMFNAAYNLVMQELERGDSGLRSFKSVYKGLAMYPNLERGMKSFKTHHSNRFTHMRAPTTSDG